MPGDPEGGVSIGFDEYSLRWVYGCNGGITYKAVFRFPQPEKRIIKATVWFSQFLPAVEYEIPVSVKTPNVSTLFAVIDKPDAFRYDTEYEAEYKGMGKVEATRIELNHNPYLPYDEFTTGSYDRTTSKLKFSIPGKPVCFDYALPIFYKVNGSEAENPAELTVSNFCDQEELK